MLLLLLYYYIIDQDLLANDRYHLDYIIIIFFLNYSSVIIITMSGYIKRIPIEEFEAQSRGGNLLYVCICFTSRLYHINQSIRLIVVLFIQT